MPIPAGLTFPKPTTADLYILESPRLTADARQELLSFNRQYQDRTLKFFAALRLRQQQENPTRPFPGMFAEVNAITGVWRPESEQHVWSWGDCRGLGIWSYFLAKDVVPRKHQDVAGVTLALKPFYEDYVDFLYAKLGERMACNQGRLPFLADPATNRATSDPRNNFKPGESDTTGIFAAAGFAQYGILRGNDEALKLGFTYFEQSVQGGTTFTYVDHMTGLPPPTHGQGFMMVTAGVAVDVLKCMAAKGDANLTPFALSLRPKYKETAARLFAIILRDYCKPETGEFWENNTAAAAVPHRTADGQVICDPGHCAEACAFCAELLYILTDDECRAWLQRPKAELLAILVRILTFIDTNAYSPSGLMYKNIDILTRTGVADRVDTDGAKYKTAPWWNVREMAAAAMKLYQLTGDDRCFTAYRKAQNAAYLNYPNANLDGLMTQTLDADTRAPLPFFPATGNLDPMHSPRAAEREIEALELIKA